MQKKILIAYYSYSGNTKDFAEKIQKITEGDLCEINPCNSYPTNYNDVVEIAKIEKNQNYMPEIKDIDKNIEDYDVIFVGTPVWWYTMASPLKTFLSNHNFSEKMMIPFCTHGGGGESATFSDIKKFADNATVKVGYASYEKTVTEDKINEWLKKIDF